MKALPAHSSAVLGRPASGSGGFSLVEVVISLAVMSVCMVTMLGLMPAGMVSLRHSIDATTEGEIVKQLSAQIRLTPFSELDSYRDVSFFYDEEGSFLSSGPPASAPAEARYCVTATEGPPVYPGYANAPTAGNTANSVKMITLEFVAAAGLRAAGGSGRAATTNNYVVLVPNSGG